MTLIGYTMMCEQAGPKQLVLDVALAEQAGFDFTVISDHYFPRASPISSWSRWTASASSSGATTPDRVRRRPRRTSA
jgi:alkanesulfonate monooxygenase SsuD/methylene tetrahydromethanopterin reductase-like flavin-dependent oxidoreductase (luciferase family)